MQLILTDVNSRIRFLASSRSAVAGTLDIQMHQDHRRPAGSLCCRFLGSRQQSFIYSSFSSLKTALTAPLAAAWNLQRTLRSVELVSRPESSESLLSAMRHPLRFSSRLFEWHHLRLWSCRWCVKEIVARASNIIHVIVSWFDIRRFKTFLRVAIYLATRHKS